MALTQPIHHEYPGILPAEGDNAAIASRRIEPGEVVLGANGWGFEETILEGHRFAVHPIHSGDLLTSWGLPFGVALADIPPGRYLCNEKILEALRSRNATFALPARPNFKDHRIEWRFDEAAFRPGTQVSLTNSPASFLGFPRGDGRGVGTRNYVVILGTSSRTGGLAKQWADSLKDKVALSINFDGLAHVSHTEGGGLTRGNNHELTLRTLAGFLTNPNVGAFVALDYGSEPVNNAGLREFMERHGYPLERLPHLFVSAGGGVEGAFRKTREWLEVVVPQVAALRRTEQPASHLRIGLQCGGSDAFSGVSGNPLIGWMARETVRQGGAANLAETDELIGAEPYILSNVRDLATARAFLGKVERFQEWASWHGVNAEANPSGGNLYRGLYNIVIKSIGAAMKKSPDVRIDQVIDFGVPMREPGFYFMDSPGNDLESIAGQVAAGCNVILFATGNGSITNFPYVPTLKVMTTTDRFRLLEREMDINAGRYQDGEPMELLGQSAFNQMLRVASGERSSGERAGHSQVQLWREWRQTGPGLQPLPVSGKRDGAPLIPAAETSPVLLPLPPVGLVVPTSLCAGQIGLMIARRLNNARPAIRHVALAHTEGCGNSSGEAERLLLQCLCGYLQHPAVARALLLEHGCEKTHNDALRNAIKAEGLEASKFGWASIQMDGGIERVTAKVEEWFRPMAAESARPARLVLGLDSSCEVDERVAGSLAWVALAILKEGGSVIVPELSFLCASRAFTDGLGLESGWRVTTDFGQAITQHGLHCMHSPTTHFVENSTALAACGTTVLLGLARDHPLPGHPFVPLGQLALEGSNTGPGEVDLCLLSDQTGSWPGQIIALVRALHAGRVTPKAWLAGAGEIQVSRGLSGISL